MQIKSLVTKFGKGAASKQFYIYETWARWVARGVQLILALIAAGIYARRVDLDRRAGNPQASAWVYAVSTAGLSSITCLVYAVPNPFLRSHRLFAWDFVLFILWVAVFGAMASIFLPLPDDQDEYQGTSVTLMTATVWLDLVNCLLWLITGVYGCVRTLVARKVDAKINSKLDAIEDKVNGKINDKINDTVGGRFGGFSRQQEMV
ncbi:hypothetical protein F5X96DRAFT_667637 [Biscogniauxia mediterranea]|nr:hypothetical protein F5X96DRAFT_667637 [Biscogniauxia mediterranea]